MPSSGRIEVNEAQTGSGFALEPRLVVTARHVLQGADAASIRFVPHSGTAGVSVDAIEDDPALDIAVLHLREDVTPSLRLAQAIQGARFEIDAQPRPNDPLLTGNIDAVQWPVVPQGTATAHAMLQLRLDQSLGDHRGYSGAAVCSAQGMAVGVLIEQIPERTRARDSRRATPYLYAVPIKAVLERFDISLPIEPGQTEVAAPSAITSARASLSPPPPAELFVARQAELDRLGQFWSGGGSPAVLLHGLPGAGKTALAIKGASDASTRFPDGIFYFDLKGLEADATSVQQVFHQLFTVLGLPETQWPSDSGQQSALLNSLLEGKRFLLVLDDVLNEAQIRPLLLRAEGCGTLVTSRSTLPALTELNRIEIDAFDESSALALLERLVDVSRVEAEDQHAKRLIELCGGLPLALQISGGRLATRPDWSIEQYADALEDEKRRLERLQLGDLDVRASIMLSYRLLNSDDQHTLRTLGIVKWSNFEEGAAVAASGHEAAGRHLEGMVDAGLLSPRPGRLVIHELVRVFAAERLEGAERHRALARLGTYYTERSAFYIDQLQTGGTDAPDALRWAVLERANLDELPSKLIDIGEDELCVRLVLNVGPLYTPLYAWAAWARILRVGVEGAQRSSDTSAEMRLQHNRAIALAQLGETDRARDLYDQVLAQAQAAGDQALQARVLAQMATLHKRLGHPEIAVPLLEQATSLYRAVYDDVGEAKALGDLANCLDDLGHHEEALDRHRDAIERFKGLDDLQSESLEHGNAGIALHRLGRLDEAEDAYRRAFEGFEHLGASVQGATAKRRMAEIVWLKGRVEAAEQLFDEALETLEAMDATYEVAETLGAREGCLTRDERHAEALNDSLRAAELFASANDLHAQAVETARAGILYLELGEEEKAIDACVRAERLFLESGDRPDIARAVALTTRAQFAFFSQSLEEAEALWISAAEMYAAVGHAQEGLGILTTGAAMLDDLSAGASADRCREHADALLTTHQHDTGPLGQVGVQGNLPPGRRAELMSWVGRAAQSMSISRHLNVVVAPVDQRHGALMRVNADRIELDPSLFEEPGTRGHLRVGWHVHVLLAGQELMRRGIESDGHVGSLLIDLIGEWVAVHTFAEDGNPPFRSSPPPTSPRDVSALGSAVGAALAGSGRHQREVEEWLARNSASPYLPTIRRLLPALTAVPDMDSVLRVLADEYQRHR